MKGIAKGIAHLSYPGGGTFLPARNPYDRQLLAEHVADSVRIKGRVQVLVDNQRWVVQDSRGPFATSCAGCGLAADSACYSAARGRRPYCVKCAFGSDAAFAPPQPQPQRWAG